MAAGIEQVGSRQRIDPLVPRTRNWRSLAGSLALVLCGLLALPAAQAQPARKARLGHSFNAGHPVAVAMEQFAAAVAEGTQGRVTIQIYPGAALGGEDKMWQATQSGLQEFVLAGGAPISGRIKEYQIFDFPFVFDDVTHFQRVFDGPMGANLLGKLDQINVVGLGWGHVGFRNLTNSRRPVNTAADISGLKVRVMQNPVALDAWKAFGANPVAMSFTEVFVALETRAIDAQENPLGHIETFKLNEVQKYVTVSRHVQTPTILAVSKRLWNSLSPADQTVLREASAASMKKMIELTEASEARLVNVLKDMGMEVTVLPPAESARLREMAQPVVQRYTESIGPEFVRAYMKAVEDTRIKR